MASTKAATAIWNGQSLSAGGGPTTSSAVNLTDGYGATVNIKLTNGATGPTTPAEVEVEVSEDNSEWYKTWYKLIGGTANNEIVSVGAFEVPPATQYLRLVATHPTGQAVTVDADLSELTAI
jgi:hypothetical protein